MRPVAWRRAAAESIRPILPVHSDVGGNRSLCRRSYRLSYLQASGEADLRRSRTLAARPAALGTPRVCRSLAGAGSGRNLARFVNGLTPSLGGALDLELASGTDPSTLVGTTFQLFNWSSPLPASVQFSSFETTPGLSWDLTNLDATGTVTLTSDPEPSALVLAAIGLSIAATFGWPRRLGGGKYSARHVSARIR